MTGMREIAFWTIRKDHPQIMVIPTRAVRAIFGEDLQFRSTFLHTITH
jgi:hypothetical protein